ncbi:MAG: hypothetical protein V3R94_07585 [Acidobacteriota bacterium]
MKKWIVLGLFFSVTGALWAHTHLGKTVTTNLPGGIEVSVSYSMTPAPEIDPAAAPVDTFINPWAPLLRVSQPVKLGSADVAMGMYTLGLIKSGSGEWALALHPGRLVRKEAPVGPQVIRLDSMYSSSEGTADHLVVDFSLGKGKLEDKVVVTFHWGSIYLAAELAGKG